jgi:hypothetical protein
MKAALIGLALAMVTAVSVAGVANSEPQRFQGGRQQRYDPLLENVQANTPYDGRFVFVRLRYNIGFGGRRGGGPPWSHDYPQGEVHFTNILKEITYVRARLDGSNILALDDPELFNYPIAYMAEPGFWSMTDRETAGLRAYLKKGGFIVFDDFRDEEPGLGGVGHWENLQQQMRQVLPEARWIEITDGQHPIWHSFFEIPDTSVMKPPPNYDQSMRITYWGIFEDNDPKKRLIAVANVNGDLSEYWEFSGQGFAPVELDNEAYKFGINFFIYGLTH